MSELGKWISLGLAIIFASIRPADAGDKSKLELTGWMVAWDNGDSWRSFEKNVKLISRVCPQWFMCGADGMPVKAEGVTEDYQKKTVQLAHANGVKVLALTNNFANNDWDAVRVEKFLNDPQLMKKHAQKLVEMAKAEGADGVDLDYELLKAGDRDNYSRFVELIAKECHRQGMLAAVAVHPKTDEPGNWDGAQAQDWKRLGAAVDFFRPMCYDCHWATSEAGPIAPLDWTKQVLGLALRLVPAGKIELGIPAYGYDWKGKTSNSYTWKQFQDVVKAHGPAKRDPATGELTFKYGDREVWFVDTQALDPKFTLAKESHIRGLGLWRLGSENTDFWDLVRKNE